MLLAPLIPEMRAVPIIAQTPGSSLTSSLDEVGVAVRTASSIADGGSTSQAIGVGVISTFGNPATFPGFVRLVLDVVQADAEL